MCQYSLVFENVHATPFTRLDLERCSCRNAKFKKWLSSLQRIKEKLEDDRYPNCDDECSAILHEQSFEELRRSPMGKFLSHGLYKKLIRLFGLRNTMGGVKWDEVTDSASSDSGG
ncbi:hypothetical protein Tco_0278713 [Tanacetum coccineum]